MAELKNGSLRWWWEEYVKPLVLGSFLWADAIWGKSAKTFARILPFALFLIGGVAADWWGSVEWWKVFVPLSLFHILIIGPALLWKEERGLRLGLEETVSRVRDADKPYPTLVFDRTLPSCFMEHMVPMMQGGVPVYNRAKERLYRLAVENRNTHAQYHTEVAVTRMEPHETPFLPLLLIPKEFNRWNPTMVVPGARVEGAPQYGFVDFLCWNEVSGWRIEYLTDEHPCNIEVGSYTFFMDLVVSSRVVRSLIVDVDCSSDGSLALRLADEDGAND